MILREEDEGGRAMVIRDDERVRPGYGDKQVEQWRESLVSERENLIFWRMSDMTEFGSFNNCTSKRVCIKVNKIKYRL